MESENILEVRGVSDRTTMDTVEMYFENTRRSGGGDIKNIDEKEGVFYIVFEDEDVIQNVLHKRHEIHGTAIEVCRYVPPPPPKPVSMYPNKVFIQNISEKTTKAGLENFLEAKTCITPTSIEYGEIEGTALVTFEEDLDFEKLQLACKKRSLDKSYLEVSRVPITNCVIVRNISEKTSLETLEIYFDNERRSGVTGVLDVKLFDGFCLVYFEEPEAVDVVCKRQHRVDGQNLDVKIYYECLGQVESEEEGPFQPPGPLELTDLDVKKLRFLIKSPPNQKAVEKQLEDVYGKPVWPKKSKSVSLTIECTLTAEIKDCTKLANTWKAKVKENLNNFFDLLLVTKHSTFQKAFPLVLNELKSLTISDAVLVVLEKSNHELYVVGHKQASQEVSKQIRDIIYNVEKDIHVPIQEIALGLDPSMIRYLSTYCLEAIKCIENDLASEHVIMKIGKDGIVIKGTENGISRARFSMKLIMKSIPTPLVQDERGQDYLQDIKNLSSVKDSGELQTFEEISGKELKSYQHFVECATCGNYSDFYCNNCHQRMCENCKAKHSLDPDNQNHEITLYSNRKMMFSKENCKLHPTKHLDLCCNDCKEAVCSLCTTTDIHKGHNFMDLERVFTKHKSLRLKDICNIRDDILPKSKDLLEHTKCTIADMKRNLKDIRESMQEQAENLKSLVDEVLSKNLQVIGDFEDSAFDGLSTQEETLSTYVSDMQRILEELQVSVSSLLPSDIVRHMKDNRGVPMKPIPVGAIYPLPVFTKGLLCKEEISKEFGFLQMEAQGSKPPL